jgi:serine/threonine-protein kinase HipA
MEKRLRVLWWDGSTIGHLVHRGPLYFAYDPEWIERGLNLSPLSLPFHDVAFNGAKGVEGLPGLLADCLPDAWGRRVARAEFAKNKWGEPTALSLLAWRGKHGLGAIFSEPPMEACNPGLEKISAAALAKGALEIERGEPCEILPLLARGGTAGGAMPKALVVLYPDGSLRVGEPEADGGLAGILKLDLSQDGAAARCEHAITEMARRAGVHVAETRLIEESPGSARAHLFVRRFDLAEGDPLRRVHFHSAAGLLHKTADALDYRDLFRMAIQLQAPLEDIGEVARRMIFNVLASNLDDHGKNHAFQLDEVTRTWSPTPAYDLTFSPGILQRGMTVAGEVWPNTKTMEALCCDAGLSSQQYKETIEAVIAATSEWKQFANNAGVPTALTAEVEQRLQKMRKETLGEGITTTNAKPF